MKMDTTKYSLEEPLENFHLCIVHFDNEKVDCEVNKIVKESFEKLLKKCKGVIPSVYILNREIYIKSFGRWHNIVKTINQNQNEIEICLVTYISSVEAMSHDKLQCYTEDTNPERKPLWWEEKGKTFEYVDDLEVIKFNLYNGSVMKCESDGKVYFFNVGGNVK